MLATVSLLLAFSSASALALTTGSLCKEAILPVHVTVQTVNLDLARPNNQIELTALITRLTSESSNVTSSITDGTTQLDAIYDIYTQLCVPSGFTAGGVVEFAIHG